MKVFWKIVVSLFIVFLTFVGLMHYTGHYDLPKHHKNDTMHVWIKYFKTVAQDKIGIDHSKDTENYSIRVRYDTAGTSDTIYYVPYDSLFHLTDSFKKPWRKFDTTITMFIRIPKQWVIYDYNKTALPTIGW